MAIWYDLFRSPYHDGVREDDVLMTLPEVAADLKVSHVTAWRIVVREKRIPAQKVGQTWAVWRSAVDEYKARRPDRPTPGRPRKPPTPPDPA